MGAVPPKDQVTIPSHEAARRETARLGPRAARTREMHARGGRVAVGAGQVTLGAGKFMVGMGEIARSLRIWMRVGAQHFELAGEPGAS